VPVVRAAKKSIARKIYINKKSSEINLSAPYLGTVEGVTGNRTRAAGKKRKLPLYCRRGTALGFGGKENGGNPVDDEIVGEYETETDRACVSGTRNGAFALRLEISPREYRGADVRAPPGSLARNKRETIDPDENLSAGRRVARAPKIISFRDLRVQIRADRCPVQLAIRGPVENRVRLLFQST